MVGRESSPAVLGDIHPVHDLSHSLPQLIALLRGQQPVQNYISIVLVLETRWKGAEEALSEVWRKCVNVCCSTEPLKSTDFTKRLYFYIRINVINNNE